MNPFPKVIFKAILIFLLKSLFNRDARKLFFTKLVNSYKQAFCGGCTTGNTSSKTKEENANIAEIQKTEICTYKVFVDIGTKLIRRRTNFRITPKQQVCNQEQKRFV